MYWPGDRTAQHQRDAHCRIVHGIAQEERRRSIGTSHDEIADVVGRESLRTVDQVVEFDHAPRRDPETRRVLPSCGDTPFHLFRRKRRAGTGVAWRATRGELRAARQRKFLRRAEAWVCQARLAQPRRGLGMERTALALPVRAVRAIDIGAFVPLDPEPAQVGEQLLEVTLLAALRIGVLHAQHHAPAARSRGEMIEERGPGIADVQAASRARRESGGLGAHSTWPRILPDRGLTAPALAGARRYAVTSVISRRQAP